MDCSIRRVLACIACASDRCNAIETLRRNHVHIKLIEGPDPAPSLDAHVAHSTKNRSDLSVICIIIWFVGMSLLASDIVFVVRGIPSFGYNKHVFLPQVQDTKKRFRRIDAEVGRYATCRKTPNLCLHNSTVERSFATRRQMRCSQPFDCGRIFGVVARSMFRGLLHFWWSSFLFNWKEGSLPT